MAGRRRCLRTIRFAAQFDSNKPIRLEGVVTSVKWMNPLARFYIDATYKIRISMKHGDKVVVGGFLAENGSTLVNAHDVKLAVARKCLLVLSVPDRVA
jgi:hypothetical protein